MLEKELDAAEALLAVNERAKRAEANLERLRVLLFAGVRLAIDFCQDGTEYNRAHLLAWGTRVMEEAPPWKEPPT